MRRARPCGRNTLYIITRRAGRSLLYYDAHARTYCTRGVCAPSNNCSAKTVFPAPIPAISAPDFGPSNLPTRTFDRPTRADRDSRPLAPSRPGSARHVCARARSAAATPLRTGRGARVSLFVKLQFIITFFFIFFSLHSLRSFFFYSLPRRCPRPSPAVTYNGNPSLPGTRLPNVRPKLVCVSLRERSCSIRSYHSIIRAVDVHIRAYYTGTHTCCRDDSSSDGRSSYRVFIRSEYFSCSSSLILRRQRVQEPIARDRV